VVLMIKNARADRVVRELASRTGETIADAVTIAAEERLARLPKTTGRIDRDELERVLARIRSYPITDYRTADEILGYDENGLPS
jgi:antitoxin VapB